MTIHPNHYVLLAQAMAGASTLPTQVQSAQTNTGNVTIVDRHMGSGKSTEIMQTFESGRRYIVVVPLMTEVGRIIKHACQDFYQPLSTGSPVDERATGNPFNSVFPTKRDALRALLEAGHNIVCSHKLFSEIGSLAREGMLLGYDVIIDEVLSVAEVATGISQMECTITGPDGDTGWRELYLGEGYISIDPGTGQIAPTEKWRDLRDKLSGNLSTRMFAAADAGRLYTDQDGMSADIIMSELPTALLRHSRSLKVYTYMAEGAFMAAYMRKHGIQYHTETDPVRDAKFREKARSLITVKPMSRLIHEKFSYSAQQAAARRRNPDRAVAQALYRAQRDAGEISGIDKDKIMVTSAKCCWHDNGKPGVYAKGSRLWGGAHWVPNTTRGTNDYAHCSHLIYLWDQHANAHVSRFLGVDDQRHRDLYAVSEFLQWVYRSRVRRGEPVTLYLPSARMRKLFARWLDGEL